MKKETITVQDREGNAVAGAEVYIRTTGGSLITLYSDNGVTTTSNPLTTDNDGKCEFYAADGTYVSQVFVEGVQLNDDLTFQHYDAEDNEIAALRSVTSAADKGFRFTGSGTGEVFDLTDFALTFLDDADAAAVRTTLGLVIGTNVQAFDAELAAIAGLTSAADKGIQFTGSGTAATYDLTTAGKALLDDADAAAQRTTLGLTANGSSLVTAADAAAAGAFVKPTESLIIACSDETTLITTGTSKATFRMPYAFTLSEVRASVGTAPTGSTIIIDINEGGTTILSTKLSIDVSEKTSTTAASAAVISDSSLADDAEITIDFDQVGSTIPGAGVKVTLIGSRT